MKRATRHLKVNCEFLNTFTLENENTNHYSKKMAETWPQESLRKPPKERWGEEDTVMMQYFNTQINISCNLSTFAVWVWIIISLKPPLFHLFHCPAGFLSHLRKGRAANPFNNTVDKLCHRRKGAVNMLPALYDRTFGLIKAYSTLRLILCLNVKSTAWLIKAYQYGTGKALIWTVWDIDF